VNATDLRIITAGDKKIDEGVHGKQFLTSAEDVVDVIGICIEHRTRAVLLHAENLTEQFFDLSTGIAGDVLQKFRNYHIRLAIVMSPDGPIHVSQSSKFREMVLEESKGEDFRVFEERASAEAWLIGE
jgi:PadR family transcriptional regulator AphA